MPQFDTLSFFSQLIGVFLSFIYLYFYFTLIGLPSIATILKVRNSKLISLNTIDKVPATAITDETLKGTEWPFKFLVLWPKLDRNQSFGKNLMEQLCRLEAYLSSMTVKMIWFNSLLLLY